MADIKNTSFETGVETWTGDARISITQSSTFKRTGTYSMRVAISPGDTATKDHDFATDHTIVHGKTKVVSWVLFDGQTTDDDLKWYTKTEKSGAVLSEIGIIFKRQSTAGDAGKSLHLVDYATGSFRSYDTDKQLTEEQWYKLEIFFNGTNSTITIYEADGTTVWASVTRDFTDILTVTGWQVGVDVATDDGVFYVDDVLISDSTFTPQVIWFT